MTEKETPEERKAKQQKLLESLKAQANALRKQLEQAEKNLPQEQILPKIKELTAQLEKMRTTREKRETQAHEKRNRERAERWRRIQQDYERRLEEWKKTPQLPGTPRPGPPTSMEITSTGPSLEESKLSGEIQNLRNNLARRQSWKEALERVETTIRIKEGIPKEMGTAESTIYIEFRFDGNQFRGVPTPAEKITFDGKTFYAKDHFGSHIHGSKVGADKNGLLNRVTFMAARGELRAFDIKINEESLPEVLKAYFGALHKRDQKAKIAKLETRNKEVEEGIKKTSVALEDRERELEAKDREIRDLKAENEELRNKGILKKIAKYIG